MYIDNAGERAFHEGSPEKSLGWRGAKGAACHIRNVLQETWTLDFQFLSLASNLDCLIRGGAKGAADFGAGSAARFARRTSSNFSRSDAPSALSLSKDVLNFLPFFRPSIGPNVLRNRDPRRICVISYETRGVQLSISK